MKELRERTKEYALGIIRLYGKLPTSTEAQVIGRQFLRSGTSVGAHYREANRARSDAEFISKIEGGLQELDETDYWLDLLRSGKIYQNSEVDDLIDETKELIAIFTTIAKRLSGRLSGTGACNIFLLRGNRRK